MQSLYEEGKLTNSCETECSLGAKKYVGIQSVGPLKPIESIHNTEVAVPQDFSPIGPKPINLDMSKPSLAALENEGTMAGLAQYAPINQIDPHLSPSRSTKKWKKKARLGEGFL